MTTIRDAQIQPLEWRQKNRLEPLAVTVRLDAFCEEYGLKDQDEAAAANWLWPELPVELREKVKLASRGNQQAQEELVLLWRRFRAGWASLEQMFREVRRADEATTP